METFENVRIKWPYATHLVDRKLAVGLLPPMEEINPGSLLLARVQTIGRHKDLEDVSGRRIALFVGDLFVAVLGNRYATDQFEGLARCSGQLGHIFGIGGVSGEVVSMNNRMTEPTVIEWVGRLAGPDGKPLHLSQFQVPVAAPKRACHPVTILSLGASMNAGKTTTAAQIIRSLTVAGHRVVAAKITGTACRKDPLFLYDAGAVEVLDFTDAGWPSTAGCSLEELRSVAGHLRAALHGHRPDFVVIEIADGIVQRETAMLLADDAFRESIDAVTYAGGDALTCESGVRRLTALGYVVVATAGFVANSRLGIAEAEEACGIRCYDGVSILAGGLVPIFEQLAGSTRHSVKPSGGRVLALPARPEAGSSRVETNFTAAGMAARGV